MTQSDFFEDAPSALFHPEAKKDKMEGVHLGLSQLIRYSDIPFMAIENEGSTEKINGIYCYILRLYSHLINGQKALVTLKGIRVFFDILVPDGKSPDECETKIRDILSGNVKTFSVEHTKASLFMAIIWEKSHICEFI
ncbi:hypothetical protein RhiirA5_384732 [Rhizophagus irregularis]|uniref:Uncharacterized protein n=1 Tax=Rhizophagus irregularis TaxID=588596 RepID=A0A2N0NRX2_9GLOM|nr:hypothetical protein RhiirA5_384732 [Rhizophagus irregularis]